MSGHSLALPFLIINMGGEMIYILNQRLLAQKIPVDKADKVRSDVIRHLFSEEFIRELLVPQQLYSMTSTRQVFDKIAQSSIMKLQTSSMNKLFDLMLMGVKMQILNLAYPEQLLKLTLNHIQELSTLTTAKECLALLNCTSEKLVKIYSNLSSAVFNRIKQALLRFFQNRLVKVTMFIHTGLQLPDGTMKIPTSEGIPQSDIPGKLIHGKSEEYKILSNTQKYKRSSLSTRHPLQVQTDLGNNMYDPERQQVIEEVKSQPISEVIEKDRGAVAKWELDSLASMIRPQDEEFGQVQLFNDVNIEFKEHSVATISSTINNSIIEKFAKDLEESKIGQKTTDDDELLDLL
jgi:hypothetical protein